VVSVEKLFLLSIAAVAARWIDRQQFLEVDLGDRLQFVRHRGLFETFRQSVEPGSVFVLQCDQRRGQSTADGGAAGKLVNVR